MLVVKTYLKPSNGMGIGLYSAEFIKHGTIWWTRDLTFDKLISKEEFHSYPEHSQKFIEEYGFLEKTGDWHLCIDNARFTNHSINPNSENTWDASGALLSCYAIRDIQQDEEILCNYLETCITCIDGLSFDAKE